MLKIKVELKIKEKKGKYYIPVDHIKEISVIDAITLLENKYEGRGFINKTKKVFNEVGQTLETNLLTKQI